MRNNRISFQTPYNNLTCNTMTVKITQKATNYFSMDGIGPALVLFRVIFNVFIRRKEL